MPASMPGSVNLFDFTGMTQLGQRLQTAHAAFGSAIEAIKPQFGAYMRYSAILENGSKYMPIGHIKTDPVTGKPMAGKKPIGPHIRPAIENNAGLLLKGVTDFLVVMTDQHLNGVRFFNSAAVKMALSKKWDQLLNSKPRQDAAAKAPFEFGFHRRSIRGYSNAPTSSQILGWQSAAESSRRGKQEGKKATASSKKKKSSGQTDLF